MPAPANTLDYERFVQEIGIDELARLITSQSVPFDHPVWADIAEEPEKEEAAARGECIPTKHCHCSEGRCIVTFPVVDQSLVLGKSADPKESEKAPEKNAAVSDQDQ